jgi:hypothetical protein
MRRVSVTAFLVMVIGSAQAPAQVLSRATPPPARTAAGSAWYANRDAIFVLGTAYYPAGASRFFNGNTMVPVTEFDGVPIYQDATLEPFSLVFVPIGRGLVQPYEARRAGPLAGTTGSRAPSFPVQTDAEASEELPDEEVVTDPTLSSEIAVPVGTSYGPCGTVAVNLHCGERAEPVRTEALANAPAPPPPARVLRTAIAPEYQSAIWIEFAGTRWFSVGRAMPFEPSGYEQVGEYYGTPVYRAVGQSDTIIYVPPVDGMVTPYRKAPPPP